MSKVGVSKTGVESAVLNSKNPALQFPGSINNSQGQANLPQVISESEKQKLIAEYHSAQAQEINNKSWYQRLAIPVLRVLHQSPEIVRQQVAIIYGGYRELALGMYEAYVDHVGAGSKPAHFDKTQMRNHQRAGLEPAPTENKPNHNIFDVIKKCYQKGIERSGNYINNYREQCEQQRSTNGIGSILGGAEFSKGNAISDLINLHPITAYANPVMEVADAAYDEALLALTNDLTKRFGGDEKLTYLELKKLQRTDVNFIAGKYAFDVAKITGSLAINPQIAASNGFPSGLKVAGGTLKSNVLFSGVISTGEEFKRLSLPKIDKEFNLSESLANISANTLSNTANSMGMAKLMGKSRLLALTDDFNDFLGSAKDASLTLDTTNPLSVIGHFLVIGATTKDLLGDGPNDKNKYRNLPDIISKIQNQSKLQNKEIKTKEELEEIAIRNLEECGKLEYKSELELRILARELGLDSNEDSTFRGITDKEEGIIYVRKVDYNFSEEEQRAAITHELRHWMTRELSERQEERKEDVERLIEIRAQYQEELKLLAQGLMRIFYADGTFEVVPLTPEEKSSPAFKLDYNSKRELLATITTHVDDKYKPEDYLARAAAAKTKTNQGKQKLPNAANKEIKTYSLWEMQAQFGFLDDGHSAVMYLNNRIKLLIADSSVSPEDIPQIRVLASQGMGINAIAGSDGTIIVSPELLVFIETVEELDGVLMHELAHILHHHNALQDSERKRTMRKLSEKLGIARIHEWDADITAFYWMAEEKRQTNPMGYIRFLERLRELPLGKQEWDKEHGALADRVLNLKALTGLMELDSGSDPSEHILLQELTVAEFDFTKSLEKLPKGQYVSKILKARPQDDSARNWDSWINSLSSALESCDLNTVSFVLNSTLEKYQEEYQRIKNYERTSNYQRDLVLIGKITDKFDSLVRKKCNEDGISGEALDVQLAVEFYCRVNIPFHTQDSRFIPDIKKPGQAVGIIQSKRKTMLQLLAPDALDNLAASRKITDAIKRIKGSFPAANIYNFAVNCASRALEENGKFGFDNLNWNEYLEHSVLILQAAEQMAKEQGIAVAVKGSSNIQNANQAWSEIVYSGTIILCRYDSISQGYGEKVKLESRWQIQLDRLSAMRNNLASSCSDITPLDEADTFLRDSGIIKENLSLVPEIKAILARCDDNIRNRRTIPDADIVELAKLLNLIGDSFISEELFPSENAAQIPDRLNITHRNKILLFNIHNLFAAVDDKSIDDESFFENNRKLINLGLNTLDQSEAIFNLVEVVPATKSLEQFFSLREGLKKPSLLKSKFSEEAMESILRQSNFDEIALELLINLGQRMSPAELLKKAGEYCERIPVFRDSNVTVTDVVGVKAVKRAELSLFKAIPDINGFLSKDDLHRLLIFSFFIVDPLQRNIIQRKVFKMLTLKSSFSEIRSLLEKYQNQDLGFVFEAAELLDDLASTPDELAMLRNDLRNLISFERRKNHDLAGKMIILELSNRIRKKGTLDRLELFSQLIRCYQGDEDLQTYLENAWWETYFNNSTGVFKNEFNSGFILESDTPFFLSLESVRAKIYQLSLGERMLLMRELLIGPEGILGDLSNRRKLGEQFLQNSLAPDAEVDIQRAINDCVFAVLETAGEDDLALSLIPFLRERFAMSPKSPGNWKRFAEDRADDAAQDRFVDPDDFPRLKAEQAAIIQVLMSGADPKQKFENPIEKLIEQLCRDEEITEVAKLGPIEFTLEFGSNLDAPGARALQLLGQVVEMSDSAAEAFSKIYDSRKGQTKLAAWETLKQSCPDYAAEIVEFGERLGGGSLYSVFKVTLKDGSVEAVRILNPNALYRSRKFIAIMREAMKKLQAQSPAYVQVGHLIDLIEQWIENELKDETFETDDIEFRKWQGWQPNTSFADAKICVPISKATGTAKVRRDQFIEGKNFTELNEFPAEDQKRYVALGAQHYFTQLKGSDASWKVFFNQLADTTTKVHSDISKGNLKIMNDGRLAIMDRGMYLEFNAADRNFLNQIANAQNPQARAEMLVDFLIKQDENNSRLSLIDRTKAIEEVRKEFAMENADPEKIMLKAFVAVQRNAVIIPLRFMLLFKNINAWRQLAREVGFDCLKDALSYHP